MYRQIIIPTEKAHNVELPKEYYGIKVEVIAFPFEDNMPAIDKNVVDPDKFYNRINLDFTGFIFNRDEANER